MTKSLVREKSRVIRGFTRIAGAMLREYLDSTVRNEQDIQELIGLPIIGHIELESRKMKRNQ